MSWNAKRHVVYGGDNVVLSGGITSQTETQKGTTATTLVIELLDHTFKNPLTVANKNAIIVGITGDYASTGWDDIVNPTLSDTDVTRTSDVIVTIDIGATASYDIGLDETITVAIPVSVVNEDEAPDSVTFTITRDSVSAEIDAASTLISQSEDGVRNATVYNILLDLTGENWVASGATFNAQRQNIIDGITGDSSDGFGWDDEVQPNISVTRVVRTSNTRVTVEVVQQADYYIGTAETVSVLIPATAIDSHDSAVSAGSFTISDTTPTVAVTGTLGSGANETDVHSSGTTIILTLTNGEWVATVGADNAITTALISGITGDSSSTEGWDATVGSGLDHNDVVRTSDTVVTITLNDAYPLYGIPSNETISVAVPATSVKGQASALSTQTFTITNQTPTMAITASITEAQIQAGGETVTLTLTNGTWKSTVGSDNSITTALIAGFSGDDTGSTGWDDVVQSTLDHSDIVRTSDTVVTITLDAAATYDVDEDETITVIVPAVAVNGQTAALASDTFDISIAFSPPQSANLIRWLKGDAGVINDSDVAASNGDSVKTWQDQSGNGNDASQTTASNMPTYRTSIINSQPAVDWDSTDDYMELADASWPSSTAQTIFIVFKVEDALSSSNIRGIYNRFWSTGTRQEVQESSGSDFLACTLKSNTNEPTLMTTSTSEYTDEAVTLLTVRRDGTSGEVWIDSTSVDTEASITDAAYSNPPGVLGATANNNANPVTAWTRFFGGLIAEVLHYDIALTTGDRGTVETHLKDKYGIT